MEINAFSAEQWEDAARLGCPGRSAEECRTEWAHRLRPSLSLGPWTPEEDARLLRLHRKHGMHEVGCAGIEVRALACYELSFHAWHPYLEQPSLWLDP
jgi:hypothetical protein